MILKNGLLIIFANNMGNSSRFLILLLAIWLPGCRNYKNSTPQSDIPVEDTTAKKEKPAEYELFIDTVSHIQTYVNYQLKFKISFPENMVMIENHSEPTTIFTILRCKDGIVENGSNITAGVQTGYMDLNQCAERFIADTKDIFPGSNIIKNDRIILNGYACHTVELETIFKEKTMIAKTFIIVGNGKIYFFSLISLNERYEKDLKDFEPVIMTFATI